jgi:hypothetical protein
MQRIMETDAQRLTVISKVAFINGVIGFSTVKCGELGKRWSFQGDQRSVP